MKFKALSLTLAFLSTHSLFGYVLEGQSWTRDRTVVMQLSLGAPRVLIDGSASFNQSALDALNIWNPYLAHLRLTAILASPVTPSAGDDENSALFSATVFGDSFGSGVLAVTLLNFRGTVMEETDTVFNSAFTWDSYRGPLNGSLVDFRRVAIHEFGTFARSRSPRPGRPDGHRDHELPRGRYRHGATGRHCRSEGDLRQRPRLSIPG